MTGKCSCIEVATFLHASRCSCSRSSTTCDRTAMDHDHPCPAAFLSLAFSVPQPTSTILAGVHLMHFVLLTRLVTVNSWTLSAISLAVACASLRYRSQFCLPSTRSPSGLTDRIGVQSCQCESCRLRA
ncbi:hypothetical protein OH77DRAFT_272360 [Trametes cingulata]|nr:hypothetical protein OH77DRAFT_272360 [Trametes cingulata]